MGEKLKSIITSSYTLIKKYKWIVIPLLIIGLVLLLVNIKLQGKGNEEDKSLLQKIDEKINKYPTCPPNLEGILTYPLMEPKYISSIIPLGNVNPPGHTSPVDHNYFASNYTERIPLYAPADAWITNITEILRQKDSEEYITQGYVVQYTVCDGLILDFASYTSVAPKIKEILKNQKPTCKYGIVKDGHEGGAEGQCYYNIDLKVKSGEELGWVQNVPRGDQYDLPFEIWAANYNVKPSTDVNWEYYDDNRYAHIICTFDLYKGELKDQYYEKFGGMKPDTQKKLEFIQRTIEPRCGQVFQNVKGTIQGVWFNAKVPSEAVNDAGAKTLSFIHNNIDPTIGEVVIGGTITPDPQVISFTPTHTGTIDREPSEVKANGNIYCYNTHDKDPQYSGGKVLVQLLSNTNARIEYQNGKCSNQETFLSPYKYFR